MLTPARIVAIGVIFAFTTAAWFILGAAITVRTEASGTDLGRRVEDLWGEPHAQEAPRVDGPDGVVPTETSQIRAALRLEQRKKGLVWYPTYRVDFAGAYKFRNSGKDFREFLVRFAFPAQRALYDQFTLRVNGKLYDGEISLAKLVTVPVQLAAGEEAAVDIAYRSQGMQTWGYGFGSKVSQARNFSLTLDTDFDGYDFMPGTLSPTSKERTKEGWRLAWKSENLISGFSIGLAMPQPINPGPIASRLTFFAPVSLLFFVTVLVIFGLVRGLAIHPMNYFFVSAAFFAFHLLFAYLVDLVDVHLSFMIAAAVSVALVVSYLRLVVGLRFALVEAAGAQGLFLVLFSYSFFFPGYTGLSISIGAVVTLAVLMQLTGRINWADKFRKARTGFALAR